MSEPGPHHPLRWRRFTWSIIDVDHFGLGFVLGLIVGYNLLIPFSQDAQEGIRVSEGARARQRVGGPSRCARSARSAARPACA